MIDHYLCITDDFDPSDYYFLGTAIDDEEPVYVNQDNELVNLANLTNDEISMLKNCFRIHDISTVLSDYIADVYTKLEEAQGRSFANLIILELQNSGFDHSKPLSVSEARTLLCNSLDAAQKYASLYCSILADSENDIERISRNVAMMTQSIPAKIRFLPQPAISKKTGKLTFCNCYAVSRIFDAIQLLFILAVQDNVIISECKICGKYFVPVSKRDEIYCSECRRITYDTKIKEDDIRRTYRTIYKTQNARKQRNRHLLNINKRYEIWANFAKKKLSECIAGEISLDEMKEAISSDDWLRI